MKMLITFNKFALFLLLAILTNNCDISCSKMKAKLKLKMKMKLKNFNYNSNYLESTSNDYYADLMSDKNQQNSFGSSDMGKYGNMKDYDNLNEMNNIIPNVNNNNFNGNGNGNYPNFPNFEKQIPNRNVFDKQNESIYKEGNPNGNPSAVNDMYNLENGNINQNFNTNPDPWSKLEENMFNSDNLNNDKDNLLKNINSNSNESNKNNKENFSFLKKNSLKKNNHKSQLQKGKEIIKIPENYVNAKINFSNTQIPLDKKLNKLNNMIRKSLKPHSIKLPKTPKIKKILIKKRKHIIKNTKLIKHNQPSIISYASNKHAKGVIINGKISSSSIKDQSIDRIISALKSNKLNKTGNFVKIKKEEVKSLIKKLLEIEKKIKKKQKVLMKNVSISLKSFKHILNSLEQDIKDKKERK